MYEGAADVPSSAAASRNPSLVVLTGVQAISSPAMKDPWLSQDAWRTGGSKLGVPALLRGLEKLNFGRGRPETSEATDGERWYGGKPGDRIPLLVENLRELWECIDALIAPSPSIDSKGDDTRLEVRFVNIGLGGASPVESNECFASLSGELVKDALPRGECGGKLSCVTDLPSGWCFSGEWPRPRGDGDRSLRAPTPKKPSSAPASLICLALKGPRCSFGTAGTGIDSSGVGGIWLKVGCIDLGRLLRSSSTSVLTPRPVLWCAP